MQEWRDDAQCPWAETDGVSGNIFKCRSCVGATGFKRGCVGAKQEDPKRTQGTRNGVRTRESAVGLVFLMRFRDYRAGLYRRNSVRLMTSCTGSCTGDLGRSAHRVASLCRLEPNWLSSKRVVGASRPGCVFLTFVFAHLNSPPFAGDGYPWCSSPSKEEIEAEVRVSSRSVSSKICVIDKLCVLRCSLADWSKKLFDGLPVSRSWKRLSEDVG